MKREILRLLPGVVMLAGVFLPAVADAGTRELRVCADPNNLPFSNKAGQGFENKIVDLIANDLGATVKYTWWAQRRGFGLRRGGRVPRVAGQRLRDRADAVRGRRLLGDLSARADRLPDQRLPVTILAQACSGAE